MKRKAALGLVTVLVMMSICGCGKDAPAKEDSAAENSGKTQAIDYNAWKESQGKLEKPSADTESETETENTTEQNTETQNENSEQVQEPGGIPMYEEIYAEILDEFYDLIVNGYYGDQGGNDCELYGGMGALESSGWAETLADALKSVGYTMEDRNGDGVLELIIGAVSEESGVAQSNVIFGVYSCIDGEPVGILDGWYRSCYLTASDGGFIYSGSGGAANSLFGKLYIEEGSDLPVWDSYYFSDIVDEETMELGWFYNITGEWDMETSEQLDISEDEFWQIQEDLLAEEEPVSMMTFYDYRVPDESMISDAADALQIDAVWADGVVTEATNYDEFVADSTEYSEAVLFSTEDIVTDIKVYALEFQDVDEEGNLIFEQTEIYAQDHIMADRPLLVWLTIEGEIPTYGISYMDQNGYVRNYGIAISGYDGSIELVEY